MYLRANSVLRALLGKDGVRFLEVGLSAFERLLPHVRVSRWTEVSYCAEAKCVWAQASRRAIRIQIPIGVASDSRARALQAEVVRRPLPGLQGGLTTLDQREHAICKLIVDRLSSVLSHEVAGLSPASLTAVADAFDDYVVASHVEYFHGISMSVARLFESLRTLSEQTYENRALTFGSVIDPCVVRGEDGPEFPGQYLLAKKYKAMSDGFRTSYLVSGDGRLVDFVDLERFEVRSHASHQYYPDWAEPIARASRSSRCSVALSRQGDILVFDHGTLRFTYRYGHWQYWNHAHLVSLLSDRARAQRVPPNVLSNVVGALYRIALDVSFRRSGALFVLLHNRRNLREIVRQGDAIGDGSRADVDLEFDRVIGQHKIQGLSRPVAVEIASLDGAVVLDNSGQIMAYGAVLQPKRKGALNGTEGSRTKAAIGASFYGLAVKISSDGDITVYHNGTRFIRMGSA